MFKSIKLGHKITSLLLAVVILSVLAVSYFSYKQSKDAVVKKYVESFRVMTSLKANAVENVIKNIEKNLELVNRNSNVINAFNQSQINFNATDSIFFNISNSLDKDLQPLQIINQYTDIVLANAQGNVIYQSNKENSNLSVGNDFRSFKPFLERQGETFYYSNPYNIIGDDYEKEMYISMVINSGGKLGYAIIILNITDALRDLIEEKAEILGENGEIILCYGSEVKIDFLHPLKFNDFNENNIKDLLFDNASIAMQNAILNKRADFVIQNKDYNRNVPILSYWSHIPKLKWGIVVKTDQEDYEGYSLKQLEIYIVVGIVIIILSTVISFIFSKKILIESVLSLKSKLELVAKGILPENIKVGAKDEIGEMAHAVRDLVEALKRTAGFAHKIGEGNYEADFQPMSEADTLGNALITMRDSIQGAEKKDRERNWIVTGVAEIGQILRLHNNLDDLGNDIIGFITDKIEAVQGAFYVVNEEIDPPLIEMKASYAYNKKKYLDAKFRFAEGLVGQSAIEKDTILRTEIPGDYVTVTSGLLGDKKPKSILIVPLITNEEVYGVLEFAGFEKFTKNQINFVEEISVIIARTIFNIKVSERTVRHLKESRKMSEELQLQQDILRQNAEEMEATQEELKRTNHRLEEQIQEVNRGQKRMQVLLENASEVITIYEQSGKIRYISPSVEPILGYSQDEMIGTSDISNVHPESASTFKELFEVLIDKPKKRVTVQIEYRQKDGNTVWLEATGTNLLSDKDIEGIVLNSRDITERIRAEKEERMRSQMQALSENSPDLITRVNTNGVFFYINPVIESLTGQAPEHFLTKTIEDADLNLEVKKSWKSIFRNVVRKRQKVSIEMDFPSLKGDRVMQINAIPEFSDKNSLESILLVSHDITERKLAELELWSTNKKIKESINYAKRIQTAILPNTEVIKQHFPDSFIFYKPKDVVSGDFPWFLKKGDDMYVAAVDCTGHGVPGALISLIGYFILNDVVNTQGALNPGKILNKLHEGVTHTLRQDINSSTRDGMDIALSRINLKEKYIEYAGAHRPLYFMRNGELEQIKGDKFPIGGGYYKTRTNFSSERIDIQEGDSIYMFSDGLPDQFGGPENRKFSLKRMRELISVNNDRNIDEIYSIFEQNFTDWKNEQKQTDDVLLIGIKF